MVSSVGMPRALRIGLTVVVLLLWVFAGPAAAAFGDCAAMAAMCEGPCGVHVSVLVTPPPSPPVLSATSYTWRAIEHRPLPFVTVFEPPPK